MVRIYKKKTNRGEWCKESMKKAISDVLEKKLGYRKASLLYGVPRSTLERRVKEMKEKGEMKLVTPLGPIQPIFTLEEEEELVRYLKSMEARLFGLNSTELRQLAYQMAVRNRKKNNFNKNSGMAGRDWLNGFLKRHKDLSIRKPEATSAARASGFNKVAVQAFFKLIGEVYDKHHLTPDRIFNSDETEISTVSKNKGKIIAQRGRKQVGSLSSAEHGKTITIEICVNATGTYMPLLFIFPRKRMKSEFLNGSPPGSCGRCSDSGLSLENHDAVSGCSFHNDSVTGTVNSCTPERACRNLNSIFSVSPEDIIPIPKVTNKEQRRSIRRVQTAILTSSPYKRELLEMKKAAKEKKETNIKKGKKTAEKSRVTLTKQKQ
ncbi:hypothetical protein ANTRET_LOCUS9486, partial [Anthophora retusa]